ncbi:MAG: dihydrodipicolinate synthase family protein [Chitinophagaceae bacterium]
MNPVKNTNSIKELIPVMLMAYKENGNIDFNGLERLTDFYLEAGSSGLFTNCYSTEMYELTPEERILNAKHIVCYVNGKVPVVAVGTFAETTDENVELIKQMYDTGVDAVIMVSSKMVKQEESDDIFYNRLEAILSRTDHIPLGIYECPVPYKRIVSPQIYEKLIPSGRITYHKDTSCNMDSVRSKLNVLQGTAIKFYEAHMPQAIASLRSGASGISAIAGNYYPEILNWICKNYNDSYKQEDIKFMEIEFERVDPLIHEAYPVSAKYFLQLRGLNITSKSRWYKDALNKEQKHNVEYLLHTFYQWCDRLSIAVNNKQ